MLALWVKVRIHPDQRERFLQGIEADALGSERDEPGCLRFNVLQDSADENVYYFYEVYEDEAAFGAHQRAPHFVAWKAVAGTLDGPAELTRLETVLPANAGYWAKRPPRE